MQVIKPGLVYEYKPIRTRERSEAALLCEANITVLEKLDPRAGAAVRARATKRLHSYTTLQCVAELVDECWERINALVPPNMYFGTPAPYSWKVGIWPKTFCLPGVQRHDMNRLCSSLGHAVIA